jgi:hypothetical protein
MILEHLCETDAIHRESAQTGEEEDAGAPGSLSL